MTFIATPPAQRPLGSARGKLATADAAAVFIGLRQTEKAFQAEVVRYAHLMGWRHYHTLRSEGSPAGWPDLVLIRRPRIVFAELKSQRNKLTADQKVCRDELLACGQEWHCWRPSDWEEIERCLR